MPNDTQHQGATMSAELVCIYCTTPLAIILDRRCKRIIIYCPECMEWVASDPPLPTSLVLEDHHAK